MKRAQVIGIGIALCAGGLAFLVARTFVRPPAAPVQVQADKLDVEQVLVARADIGLGQVATESNFRWQDWPREAAGSFIQRKRSPNAMREYSGTIARSGVTAGEPISPNKLIKPGSGGVLAAILQPGMRAMSIKISEHSAVGRLILPNDHVDILLTTRQRSKSGAGEEVNTELLLRNIRVLAIGQQIEVKEGRKNSEGNVASLELSPIQSELVAQATARGELSLSLRSIADIGSAQAAIEARKDQGSSIKVLRYGVKSKAYGVQ